MGLGAKTVLSTKRAAHVLGVSGNTLRGWANASEVSSNTISPQAAIGASTSRLSNDLVLQLTVAETPKAAKVNKKKRRWRDDQRVLSTARSPANKNTTSNAKCKRSRRSNQTPKSTKTSPRGSATSAKGSRGFWSTHKKAWSKKLWWPTGIDSPDSASTLSNGFSSEQGHVSSFLIRRRRANDRNSLKTS
jgi:hypothetical protein